MPAPEDLFVQDDGLTCPEVGRWAETKYRLLFLYDELFSTGMKNKWHQRVYIDLYAGAGISRIEGTNKYLKGSPLLALSLKQRRRTVSISDNCSVADPFDKYIFCEESGEKLAALKARANRIAPLVRVAYVHGSCDSQIDQIFKEIPKGTPSNRVLSLCFVDPFDFGIKFETLRRLSTVYIDFLVLLAIDMDANRNYDHYVDGKSPKIDEALGNTEWRGRLKTAGTRRKDFRQFLAAEFSTSMKSLGYIEQPFHQMKPVRSDESLRLYHLALFSRSQTALGFWKEVLKYSTDQIDLPLE